MKIVAMSDLHGELVEVPPCDLLLLGGDLCPLRDHSPRRQAEWLDGPFRSWLRRAPARKIIGVAGNHDWVFEQEPGRVPRDLPWTYLQDELHLWEGLRIWGTPWQPWFYDWAFNLYEPELATKWALVPEGTDVLVLHSPPHGYGDGVPDATAPDGVRRCGSPSLLARIDAVQPRLAIFGHIHEGRGQWQRGRTVLANVTLVDAGYRLAYPPWEHEMASGID